jgi:hypothetical protein
MADAVIEAMARPQFLRCTEKAIPVIEPTGQ